MNPLAPAKFWATRTQKILSWLGGPVHVPAAPQSVAPENVC